MQPGLHSGARICMHGDLPGRATTHLCSTCAQVAEAAEVIFIAVKPQYVPVVLREISPKLTEKHLIVSIAAGVTLAVLTVRTGELDLGS